MTPPPTPFPGSISSSMRPLDDLVQIKRQAKELLRAFGAGDANATRCLHACFPELLTADAKLHHAQLAHARALGFASWPKLQAFVTARMRAKGKEIGAPFDAVAVRSARPYQVGWVEADGDNDPAGGCEHTSGGTTMGGATVDVPASRVWFIEPRTDLPGGGWDAFLDEVKERRVPGVNCRGQATDDVVKRIAELSHLVLLDLSSGQGVTDASLPMLARLENLEYLYLRSNDKVTDKGLSVLASLPKLRVVRLDEMPKISDAGVAYLGGHEHLELVTMGRTACGDGAVEALADKPTLTHLTMGGETTDAGLGLLSRYPGLRNWDDATPWHKIDEYRGPDRGFLGVNGRGITDAGLAPLRELEGVDAMGLDAFYDASKGVAGPGAVHVTAMKNLRKFELPGRLITDDFLAGVAEMAKLSSISLWDAAATEKGLAELAKAEQITDVSLAKYHNLTPEGLALLSRMPRLETLSIGSRNCPDDGLGCLKDFQALRRFATANENVFTDEAFGYIAAAPKIESVTNMYCRSGENGHHTTDRFVAYLSGAESLRDLSVWGSRITDAGCRTLSRMTSLESLLFYGCHELTDAGVGELGALPKLRKLELQGNAGVTEAALSAFDRSVSVSFQPPND